MVRTLTSGDQRGGGGGVRVLRGAPLPACARTDHDKIRITLPENIGFQWTARRDHPFVGLMYYRHLGGGENKVKKKTQGLGTKVNRDTVFRESPA